MSTLSYRATNGDGGNTTFSIDTFSQDEIKVYVNEVLKQEGASNDYQISNYTATGGRIDWVGSAPTSNDRIRIVRQTKILNNGGNAVEGKATYSAGAAVKATDLNNNTKQALRSLQEHNDQLVQTYDIEPNAITNALIADDQIDSEHYVDGSIDHQHLSNDCIDGDNIQNDVINSEHYAAGSIDEEHLSNSAITSNKIAANAVTTTEILNGAVTRAKLEADIIDGTKLADNAVDSEHYTDGSIDRVHLEADIIDSTKLADNAVNSEHYVDGSIDRVHLEADIIDSSKLADNAVGSEHIQTNAVTDSEIATGTLDNRYFTETELTGGALDGRYFTETESDARYFNISSGETITSGDTFPDNDTTIATTKAINARIIDIVNDVGGFDIVESEQHFPNTNPQGQAGSAAVLSIKAASTNLVPSGTTVTIVNGNLANNANITITGVTSTIPSGFGFIVESTSTLHTYTFHRLVPKATEVTTVAGNISNINAAANNETNINAAVSNASNINAAVSNASNINAAVSNASNINAAVSNASNINSAVSNASDITTTATNITNVNNVGNNVTNVNTVSTSVGGNQTFTVTVQNVSGNKYFIDGVQTPVLKLARGKTYTFDMSDSSNSGHPLAFRRTDDSSYTAGVTTNGTAGSSGATVVFAVPANAPNSLKYYCTSHGNAMGNTITVIDDNVGIVADSISNVNTVGSAISNVNTTAGSISNVNTVASNINSVNSFFNVYRTGASNPTTSLDTGDLFFNTTSNSLKVYTGSAWVDGVTATGNFAVVTGNTFTGSNVHNDNVKSLYGTGSDLEIYHNGTNSIIDNITTGSALQIKCPHQLKLKTNQFVVKNGADTESIIYGAEDNKVVLYYDNSEKLETTSTGVKIADSLLEVNKTGGNAEIQVTRASGATLTIQSQTARSRVVTTGGSHELQLGTNGTGRILIADTTVDLPQDNQKLRIGAGQDLEIYHASNISTIKDNYGDLRILSNTLRLQPLVGNENFLYGIEGGTTRLFFDGAAKFETISTGANVTGKLGIGTTSPTRSIHSHVADGAANYMMFSNAGTGTTLLDGFLVGANASDQGIVWNCENQEIKFATNNTARMILTSGGQLVPNVDSTYDLGTNATRWRNVYADTYYGDGSSLTGINTDLVADTSPQLGADLDINNFNVLFGDSSNTNNDRLKFGNSSDLEIYHTGGGNNFIQSNNDLALKVLTETFVVNKLDDSENMLRAFADGKIELFYDGSKRLETTANGADLFNRFRILGGTAPSIQINRDSTGNDTATRAIFGLATGSNNFINGSTTDDVVINTPHRFIIGHATNEVMAVFDPDGEVQLRHDNSTKFQTTSSGVTVTGTVAATSYTGDGSNLTGINTDLVADTSPQLGGNLDVNGNAILLGDTSDTNTATADDRIRIGASQDLQLFHGPNNSYIRSNAGSFNIEQYANATLDVYSNHDVRLRVNAGEMGVDVSHNGSVDLYYDNTAKAATASHGMYFNEAYLHHHVNSGNSSEIRFTTNGVRRGSVYADNGNTVGFTNSSGGWNARWSSTTHTSHVNIHPNANNTYSLGTNSLRWANIFTNDLNLSNKGSANDVDGTWGDWTIQEGESDLFLKNNRSGKKYKFNLMEVS